MAGNDLIFANRNENYAKDNALLIDGGYIGQYSGKTLEQLQAEDPDVELIDLYEFTDTVEKRLTTDPVEVDSERYWYLLEVLPPCGWVRNGGSESFYMSEFLTGRITTHVVRIGERYFTFDAPVMSSHFDRTEKVHTWLEAQEAEEDLRPLNDPDDLDRRMGREEIVEMLETHYSIQCYDHESKRELAEALAEAANTEGDRL